MATSESNVPEEDKIEQRPKCGIVMPISEIDGLLPSHWAEILGLLKEVAEEAGYVSDLVSASDFSGIIHNRIISNLYSNEIVICDVSAKNPNVMFELGMRLTFDKPTVVIVDDETKISFDTSPLKHLIYPRDLRHGKILAFKKELKLAITATVEESTKPEYISFLKNFGTFDVQGLKRNDNDYNQFVIDRLEMLSHEISSLRSDRNRVNSSRTSNSIEATIQNALIKTMLGRNVGFPKISKDPKLFDLIIEDAKLLLLKSESLDVELGSLARLLRTMMREQEL